MLSLNLRNSKLIILYAILIAGSIICISLLACVPPVSRDALTHHLFIPKLFLQHGGIYEIPHLIVSYYPMNLDLLYLIPMYFNNDIMPKFIHFFFALVTSIMIYRYLSRRINVSYALLGVLFFLTLPVIVRLSSTVYVDLGLICFLFASLLYLFDWIESGFKLKYLIFSAVWCGLAVGTKYNGLIGLFLLSLFITFVYSRYHTGQNRYAVKAIGYCAAFVIMAMVVFSPWMVRNMAWTGNPVYPLYDQFFNATASNLETKPDIQMEEQIPISHIQIRRVIYGESWLQIALIPLRVFFQGQDDNPQYFDGKVNPFLLLLPLFSFWGAQSGTRQEKTEKFLMLFFSIFFLFYSCAQTSIRIRYFSAILPSLVILSMFGLNNVQVRLLDKIPGASNFFKKSFCFGIVGFMLWFNVVYILNRFEVDQPFSFLFGEVTRDEYIQKYRPEYAAYNYANKHLDPGTKILGIYLGGRGYYSDRYIEFSSEVLKNLATNDKTGRYIYEKIREFGFTHLLINLQLFNSLAQKYDSHKQQMLKQFFETHTVLEFSKDGHRLLRLTEEVESLLP